MMLIFLIGFARSSFLLSTETSISSYQDITSTCAFELSPTSVSEFNFVLNQVNSELNGMASFDSLSRIDEIICDGHVILPNNKFLINDRIVLDLDLYPVWNDACVPSSMLLQEPYGCIHNQTCSDNQYVASELQRFGNCLSNQVYTYTERKFGTTGGQCAIVSATFTQYGNEIYFNAESIVTDKSLCTLSISGKCIKPNQAVVTSPTMTLHNKLNTDSDKDCALVASLCSTTTCSFNTFIVPINAVCQEPSCSFYLCSETLKFLYCNSTFFKAAVWLLVIAISLYIFSMLMKPIYLWFIAFKLSKIAKSMDVESAGDKLNDGSVRKAVFRKRGSGGGSIPKLTLSSLAATASSAFVPPIHPSCAFPNTTITMIPPVSSEFTNCHIDEMGEVCDLRTVLLVSLNNSPGDCPVIHMSSSDGLDYQIQICYFGAVSFQEFDYKYTAFEPIWDTKVVGKCGAMDESSCNSNSYSYNDFSPVLIYHKFFDDETVTSCPLRKGDICAKAAVKPGRALNVMKLTSSNPVTSHRFGYRILNGGQVLEENCFVDTLSYQYGSIIESFQITSLYGSTVAQLSTENYFIQDAYNKGSIYVASGLVDDPEDTQFGAFQVTGLGTESQAYKSKGDVFNVKHVGRKNDEWRATYLLNSATAPAGVQVTSYFASQGQAIATEAGIGFISNNPVRATVNIVTKLYGVQVLRRQACPKFLSHSVGTATHQDGVNPRICLDIKSTCGEGIITLSFAPTEGKHSLKISEDVINRCYELPLSEKVSEIHVSATGATTDEFVFIVEATYLENIAFFANQTKSLDRSDPAKKHTLGVKGISRLPGLPKSKVGNLISYFVYLGLVLVGVFALLFVAKVFFRIMANKTK